MDKLRFGTAGIPLEMPNRNTIDAPIYLRKIGLDAMELEFVRSVNLTKDKAKILKKNAEDNNIKLTCHAPYFVNLCSKESNKVTASKQRILKAAEIANIAGVKSITFHAGFYQGQDSNKVFDKILSEIKDMIKTLKDRGNPIILRPETTGKASQFGSIEELIAIAKKLSQVSVCVDFAHLYARSIGKFNGEKDFSSVIKLIKKDLGSDAVKDMHIHVSGMNYTEKGERNHYTLTDKRNKFEYKGLIKALKSNGVKGIVISESPNIEKDALLMQKLYKKFDLKSI